MSDDQTNILDADRIRELLTELGRRLDERGLSARMFVVGGGAMALAYNSRRVTRDLDGVFEPKTEVYAESAAMAVEHGLPADWLNDGVKGLLPDRAPIEEGAHFEAAGIDVGVASAEYLFAMKASAARETADAEDLRFLADHLGLRNAAEALDLVDRFYSPHRLRPASHLFVETLFDRPETAPAETEDIDVSTAEPSRPPRSGDGRVSPFTRLTSTPELVDTFPGGVWDDGPPGDVARPYVTVGVQAALDSQVTASPLDRERFAALVPEELDGPDALEEIHARIVATAELAGEKIPTRALPDYGRPAPGPKVKP